MESPLPSQPCSPKRGTEARREKIEVVEDTTKQQRTGPVWNIIRIEFMNSKNTFQAKMREDIERIKKSRKVWVRSDKSNNIYQVSPHEYERILNAKITESYKLDHCDTITQINRDTAKFAQKVNMIDRLGKLEEKSAYILFKDHKKKKKTSQIRSKLD